MMDQVVEAAKCESNTHNPDTATDVIVSHGGELVSRIHLHTNHGDPFVRKFMTRVLEEVSLRG
jgi:hypothetical protein